MSANENPVAIPHEGASAAAWQHAGVLVLALLVLGFLFAQVEIQIEGGTGWAANLPTWRIESHPLLNIFWVGRPMTGYHAWALGLPVDYWTFTTIGSLLIAGSFWRGRAIRA